MKKLLLYIYFIIGCQFIVFGQDIHFSNFYNAPLIINPANTGNYIGNWRLISNYRRQNDQGIDIYKTTTLAFDMPIYYYKQMGSIGLIYINDNSANQTLSVNKLYLSIAHFVRVSSNSYLHMGFQFGYVHKKLSNDFLSLPDQFDMSTGYFNSDMPTQEATQKNKLSYLDLNWGLIWSRKSGRINSEIGLSMFHYNKPEENFLGIKNELSARYLSHAYFELKFKNNLYLKPKLLYTFQNKTKEMLIGQDLGIRFENATSSCDFNIGLFYRAGFGDDRDAVLFKSGLNYKSFNFGICYDYELPNKTKPGFSKAAFEISIQYTRPSTNVKNKTIPCETF